MSFLVSLPRIMKPFSRIPQSLIYRSINHNNKLLLARRAFSVVPSTPAFSELLSLTQKDQVSLTRKMLQDLHAQLVDLGTPVDELHVIRDAISQMDDLFMVCIAGEFNAGKSTFLNALLGDTWLKEGVLPTTTKVCVLKYGKEVERRSQIDSFGETHEDVDELSLPVDWLSNVCLVDTPGTNAIVLEHGELTKRIIPRADLVIFVTSADRPFSESERAFLEVIAKWGKKILFVVNKIDILADEGAVAEVVGFVSKNAQALLGHQPQVLAVSGKKALRAKLSSVRVKDGQDELRHAPELGAGSRLWEESRFALLEEHMRKALTAEERVLAKLLSPLGVAEQLVETAVHRLDQRGATLKGDMATVSLIDTNLEAFSVALEKDIAFERKQIRKALDSLIVRGDSFFDDKFSFSNAPSMLSGTDYSKTFMEEVLGGVDGRVREIIEDMSKMVEERGRGQARAVLDFLGRRPSTHSTSIVGTLHDSHFDGVRYRVLSKLEDEVNDTLGHANFDRDAISESITNELRSSVMQFAALEIGAVAAGSLAFFSLIDFTGGVATAGALATLGTTVLPIRKYQQKKRFEHQVGVLGNELDESLSNRLEREMRLVTSRIVDSVAPYSRFVKLEEEKTKLAHEKALKTQKDIRVLKTRITK